MFEVGGSEDMGRIKMIESALFIKPPEPLQGHGGMSPSPSPSLPVAPQHQWGPQETSELIGNRAELESDFKAVRRNKVLWEVVGSKMSERGCQRTPEQCKCKWKNLVNRYKVCRV